MLRIHEECGHVVMGRKGLPRRAALRQGRGEALREQGRAEGRVGRGDSNLSWLELGREGDTDPALEEVGNILQLDS